MNSKSTDKEVVRKRGRTKLVYDKARQAIVTKSTEEKTKVGYVWEDPDGDLIAAVRQLQELFDDFLQKEGEGREILGCSAGPLI